MNPYDLLPSRPFDSYADYLAQHGGEPIGTWLPTRAPEELLQAVARSGLRGRGGAGFPTGVKWRTLFEHDCKTRSVVCNAAEGEPGTFKDRILLRNNPYACLEGMFVAAHTISAGSLHVGIKGTFEREVARLESALAELRAAGGANLPELAIVRGPREYLFGEEKALLRFLDDGLPLPREAEYPPYEFGLGATALSPNPALVNNVETFSHAAAIARHGAEGFRARGTEDTPGTILATVCGDVARPGVFEVAAGTPVAALIERAGGATRGGVQAVLSGISSGVLTVNRLGTPADFGSLALAGAGLGSAGFIVVGLGRSMPQVTRDIARFLYVESCNQCSACKHGLRLASTALDELLDPEHADEDHVELALYGAHSAPQANRCYLPVQGSIVIPSLIENFRDQFDAPAAFDGRSGDPFPFPLLKDFDAERSVFTYDADVYRKQPDWSYAGEASAAAVEPVALPSAVRLSPDVAALLHERAEADGTSFERLADRLLRAALEER